MEERKETRSNGRFELPEWETTARHRGGGGKTSKSPDKVDTRTRLTQAFDGLMPAHRKYCGMSRRLACIVFFSILLCLLALILGLAIGLSMKAGYVLHEFQMTADAEALIEPSTKAFH